MHSSPRRSLHYCECFNLGGVGILVHGNLVRASPSAIMEISGNDHIFEYNVLHHVALDTFDTGAIHWAAYDPSMWGFIFRYNLFYKIGYKDNPCSAATSCLLAGIYADDGSYGFTAHGNVFWLPEPEVWVASPIVLYG